jgi:uncharacterized membrane protein
LEDIVGKGRLEAFSDGVLAVIITIMVLELHAPHEPGLEALLEEAPPFLAYVLSFVFIGIYWNNHHHMFHAVDRVNGGIMWANSFLLFWLSLVPFVTDWMGENHFAAVPVAVYGVVLLMSAIAYYVLQSLIIREQGPHSKLRRLLGNDWKGRLSPLLYLAGIVLAFLNPALSEGLYVVVALIWLVPDRRIEAPLAREHPPQSD